MRNWIFSMLAVLVVLGAPVGSVAEASWLQSDITNGNNAEPPTKNASDHGYKYGAGKCVFDPSANTSERTIAAHVCDLDIPKNAFVTGAWYHVLTTFTSATDAGTIAISVSGANDIVSAAAISTGTTWDAAGAIEAIPKNDDSSTWVEATAKQDVTFTVAVEALTAGKLVLFVEWVYWDDI